MYRRRITSGFWLALCAVTMLSTAVPAWSAMNAPESSVGGWAISGPNLSPLEKAYRQGVQALSDHDPNAALKLFRQCLTAKADFAEAMLGMAEAYQQQHDLAGASRWIARAVKAAPDNPHVQNSLGRLKMLRGESQAAEKAFRRALALDPDMASAWASLGQLYSHLPGRQTQATEAYEHALKIDPLNADYLYQVGTLYAAQAKDAKAADALLRASRLDPELLGARLALAGIAAKHRQWDNALKWTDSVLKRRPTQLRALWLKTDIATRAGRAGLAAATLHTIVELQPENASAWLLLGANRQGVKDSKGALAAYKKAYSIKPDLAPALNNFAWVAANQGEALDQALDAAQRAVKLNPKSAAFQDTLAWVYYARGNYAAAHSVLSNLVKLSSLVKIQDRKSQTEALIHFHYGLVLHKEGQPRAAGKWLKRAIGENLPSADAQRARAVLKALED